MKKLLYFTFSFLFVACTNLETSKTGQLKNELILHQLKTTEALQQKSVNFYNHLLRLFYNSNDSMAKLCKGHFNNLYKHIDVIDKWFYEAIDNRVEVTENEITAVKTPSIINQEKLTEYRHGLNSALEDAANDFENLKLALSVELNVSDVLPVEQLVEVDFNELRVEDQVVWLTSLHNQFLQSSHDLARMLHQLYFNHFTIDIDSYGIEITKVSEGADSITYQILPYKHLRDDFYYTINNEDKPRSQNTFKLHKSHKAPITVNMSTKVTLTGMLNRVEKVYEICEMK